jgi:hypothetical protein
MKRITCSVLASLLLLSACAHDATSTPAAAPATPAAKPAESAKPAAEGPKPAAETAKPVAETPKPPAETAKPTAEGAKAPANVDMDAAIKALMAKPEQPDQKIEIQHILISFKGAPRMPPTVTRTKEEAKVLAEKVYAEVIGGANFDEMVKKYTNDSPPGIYPLDQMSRKGMVKSFGDVGWRLKVGEIGVAPWDAQASPFGWHIIKRLK